MKNIVLLSFVFLLLFSSLAFSNTLFRQDLKFKIKPENKNFLSELNQDINISIFIYNLRSKLSDDSLSEMYTASIDKIDDDSNTASDDVILALHNNRNIFAELKIEIRKTTPEIKGAFYQFAEKLYEKILIKSKTHSEFKNYIADAKSIKAECSISPNINIHLNLSSKKLIEKFHSLLVANHLKALKKLLLNGNKPEYKKRLKYISLLYRFCDRLYFKFCSKKSVREDVEDIYAGRYCTWS